MYVVVVMIVDVVKIIVVDRSQGYMFDCQYDLVLYVLYVRVYV